jgi:hypothetical protein
MATSTIRREKKCRTSQRQTRNIPLPVTDIPRPITQKIEAVSVTLDRRHSLGRGHRELHDPRAIFAELERGHRSRLLKSDTFAGSMQALALLDRAAVSQ